MSGLFSLSRESYYAYLASRGTPISPSGTLHVLGRLSIVAFVLAAFAAWRFEHNRVKELEDQLDVRHLPHPIINAGGFARIENGALINGTSLSAAADRMKFVDGDQRRPGYQ